MKNNNKIINKLNIIFCIIGIIIALLVSILPTLKLIYLRWGHDLSSHINMIKGIEYAFVNYSFPPYINALANGLKGDCVNIVYPNIYKYIPALIDLVCDNINVAINIFIIIVNIFSLIMMYISTYEITKKRFIAVIASIFWLLYYYRLFNIYDRQAMGEYVALIFIPLLIAGFYNIYFGDKKKWWWLCLAFTGIIESHTITMFYMAILLFIMCVIFIKKTFGDKEIFFAMLKNGILIILLNIWFLVPFIYYYLEKKVGVTAMGDGTLYAENTLNTIFCFRPDIDSRLYNSFGGETFLAFIIIDIVLFITLIIILFNVIKNKKMYKPKSEDILFIIISLLAIYFLFASLGFFNHNFINSIPILRFIFSKQQWMYREIGRGGAFIAIAFAIAISKINIKIKIPKFILIILVLSVSLFSALPYVYQYKDVDSSQGYSDTSLPDYLLLPTDFSSSNIENKGGTLIIGSYRYDPLNKIDNVATYSEIKNINKVDDGISDSSMYKGVNTGDNITIFNEKRGYLHYLCDYDCNGNYINKSVIAPFYDFTGYVAYDENNNKLNISRNYDDLIKVELNKNTGRVHVFFDPPLAWKVSFYISAITLILIFIYRIYNEIKLLVQKEDEI